MHKKIEISEFLNSEYHNGLASIVNLKNEFNYFSGLDELYQELRNAFVLNPNDNTHVVVTILFLEAHNEFYIGMSQLFKFHLGKAFISLRIAIESAFNAYYFTKHSEHIKDFFKAKSNLHSKIFWHIKKYMKKYPKEFPLAQELVASHESSSTFAAHSSMFSAAYKYEHIKNLGQKEDLMSWSYFDNMQFTAFLGYYFYLLTIYYRVFKLFYDCFYSKEIKILYPDRNRRINKLKEVLLTKYKQYSL